MSDTNTEETIKPVEVRMFNPITIHGMLCTSEKVNELAALIGAEVVINTFTNGIVFSLTINDKTNETK